jgi:preprotein translocase subunit YajC
MVVIGLLLWIISATTMRKRRADMKEIHTNLGIGSKILFAGGIYGRVVGVEDETLNVEVAKGTVIKISRYAVQSVLNIQKDDSNAKDKDAAKATEEKK